MKRKNLPLSALLSGLLAVPGVALVPPALGESRTPLVQAEVFPAVMPNDVAEQIRRIARGEKPSANGMQTLQRRLAVNMQQRLLTLTAASTPAGLFPAQLTQPGKAPTTGALPASSAPTMPAPAAAPDGAAGLQRVQTQPDFQKATEVVNTRTFGSSFDAAADGSLTRRSYDDRYDITIHRSAAGADTITAKDHAGSVLVQASGEQLASTAMPADLRQKIEEARANLTQAHLQIGNTAIATAVAGSGGLAAGSGATVSRSFVLNHTDETCQIAYRSVNGDGHLTVKDPGGALLYDGPANAEADYQALPAGVRAKVKTLLETKRPKGQ